MFNKQQVQKAIKEIDENLALLTGSRQAHLALVNDVKLIQAVCMDYFNGKEEPTEGAKVAKGKKEDEKADTTNNN